MRTSSIEYIRKKTRKVPATYRNWRKALYFAAAEAYHSEVVQPLMEDHIIGTGMDYATKEDWIESKVQEWLSAVEKK